MTFLRFLMLLSLVVWLGGIIFFAFVLAPTVFSVLPTRELAGRVVARSLNLLHWTGVVSGVVFLVASIAYTRAAGAANPLIGRHLLVLLMIVLTLASQLAIAPRMQALRNELGVIDDVPPADLRRVEFNRLHHWSTRIEAAVLLLGLAALYLTAQTD